MLREGSCLRRSSRKKRTVGHFRRGEHHAQAALLRARRAFIRCCNWWVHCACGYMRPGALCLRRRVGAVRAAINACNAFAPRIATENHGNVRVIRRSVSAVPREVEITVGSTSGGPDGRHTRGTGKTAACAERRPRQSAVPKCAGHSKYSDHRELRWTGRGHTRAQAHTLVRSHLGSSVARAAPLLLWFSLSVSKDCPCAWLRSLCSPSLPRASLRLRRWSPQS